MNCGSGVNSKQIEGGFGEGGERRTKRDVEGGGEIEVMKREGKRTSGEEEEL